MVTVVDVFFPEYYVYQTEKRLRNSRGANKVSHHILYCTHTAMEIVTVNAIHHGYSNRKCVQHNILSNNKHIKTKMMYSLHYCNNTYSRKVKQSWSLVFVLTLLLILALMSVWPQIFINITSDVLTCYATGEESACMPQPSLTLICCDIDTSSIHCLEKGPLV